MRANHTCIQQRQNSLWNKEEYSSGFRTWIEYGLKHSKDALEWADFRMTSYEQIEKWWEMVMSEFLRVSLFADAFNEAWVGSTYSSMSGRHL